MQIGAMNHPQKDVLEEIRWIAEMGLEFVDLTLEPPCGASWKVEAPKIRAALDEYKLDVVGHTAFYLPLASPIEEVRQGAVAELRRCLQKFSEIGARWMNVHPDRHAPMHGRAFYIERNIETLREILEDARSLGVGVMIENLPGDFNTVEQLGDILNVLPEVGLHLDIGHANLMVETNTTESILAVFGNRLAHVHLHDNKGGHADLHLPLGSGTVDVPRQLRALKLAGYDGTITLEVFTPDPFYVQHSRDVLRKMWDEL